MEGGITDCLLRNTEEVAEKESLKSKLWRESKKIWVVAAPAIFTRFTTFGTGIISQAFIGHIGSIQLDAFALVYTVFLRFAQGFCWAWRMDLKPCGQAYGARQYHMLGIYLQRSRLVSLIASTVILPLFIFTTPILKAIGQDEEMARIAGTMVLWLIPVMYSFILAYTCQMYLQAQSKNMIIAYLAAASLTIHVFLSWLLTMKYKFGTSGAMISTVIAFWLPNIGQVIFITCGGCPQTWKGFSILAFKDLWPIFKLSLSAGAMLCLEVWYYPVLILLTGRMKNAEVTIDALSIW